MKLRRLAKRYPGGIINSLQVTTFELKDRFTGQYVEMPFGGMEKTTVLAMFCSR